MGLRGRSTLLLAKVIVSVLLQRELVIVMATLLPEMTRCTADMASSLLRFEASLAGSPGVVSSDHFHHDMRLAGGKLTVLRDHTLFDSFIGVREQCSGAQILPKMESLRLFMN